MLKCFDMSLKSAPLNASQARCGFSFEAYLEKARCRISEFEVSPFRKRFVNGNMNALCAAFTVLDIAIRWSFLTMAAAEIPSGTQ